MIAAAIAIACDGGTARSPTHASPLMRRPLAPPAGPAGPTGPIASPAPGAAAPFTATLRLAAWCDPGATEPSALDVALSLATGGTPSFRLDDNVYGTAGMAQLISAAEASDERGPLPLVRRVATDPDGGSFLELTAGRPAAGVVTLRYRARALPIADRGARHGLRHDATGIGGLGAYFLVLPASRRIHHIRIAWAPSPCMPDAQALSSFGDGPDAETTGELTTLRMASYFTGRPRTHASDDGALHVRSAWFGAPAFDVAAAAAWAARAFAAERAFFADDDPAPYHVFVRVLPAMAERSNGMGQPSSLLLAIGPKTTFGPRLRANLAHEMLHRWLGLRIRLAGPEGSALWLTEGFTVHYANVLLLRAGLISPDEFLSELDGAVTRQLANDRAAASNDEIRRGFFDDDALAVVPYTRGSLYAAELDAAIRRASHGARSLDTVVRELDRAARSAPVGDAGLRELPPSTLREIVQRELGLPGVARFDAVIARGAQPDPPSDAFGPCFQRVPYAVARYQLGFDDRRSQVEPKAIRQLVPGSAAAKAGLREGDVLVSIEASLLFPDKEATVTVTRRGTPVVVRYLPAGPTRAGFRWVRVPGVPDDRCAISP
jgi:hypothetical protein